MSKKRIIALILSAAVIIGIGFAGYRALHPSANEVSNHYQTTQAADRSVSASSSTVTSKAPKQTVQHKKKEPKRTKQASRKRQTTAHHQATKTATQRESATSAPAVVTPKHQRPTAKSVTAAPTKRSAHQANTCTLTIRGPISEGNHVLLQAQHVTIHANESVMNVLKRVTTDRKMALSYSGGGRTAYVRGIDGLFEFDKGSGSGWLYAVNHKFPGFSCGKYRVKKGDTIQWLYTEDLGKDRDAPQVK